MVKLNPNIINPRFFFSKDIISVSLLMFLIAISWSPFFPGAVGIPTIVLYLPALIFYTIYRFINTQCTNTVFLICILLEIAILIVTLMIESSLYFNRYILMPIGLLACYLTVSDKRILDKTCSCLAILSMVGLIFSWGSFFYAFFGGGSILDFPNPDGRVNHLYLSSFTNTVSDNIIRPSFIFDEPGAFSFFLCFVVLFRELLGKEKKVSFLILIGGLITFSLSHMIVLITYFICNLRFKNVILFIFPIALLIVQLSQLQEFDFFFNRFIINDGKMSGDNRSEQVENFMDIVSQDILLFGDHKCHSLPEQKCISHGDISSSPVTPVYYGGILFLIVQIITHLFFIYKAFGNKNYAFVSIAMSILLLQRPFFSTIGYQLMIYIPLFYMLKYNYKCNESLLGKVRISQGHVID